MGLGTSDGSVQHGQEGRKPVDELRLACGGAWLGDPAGWSVSAGSQLFKLGVVVSGGSLGEWKKGAIRVGRVPEAAAVAGVTQGDKSKAWGLS